MEKDTIIARSSPEGRGAIGVIRLSGENACTLSEKIITPKFHRTGIPQDRHVYLGEIRDDSKTLLDEVTCVYYRSPKSYTGEDMAEIFCHGNNILINLIIEQFIKYGARMALPGEFTRRAFINGKIDLTQAESVAELISAEAEQQVKTAAQMLSGIFGTQVKALRDELIVLISWVEASIDFPEEEDAVSVNRSGVLVRLDSVIKTVRTMMESYREGRLIREGISVTIAGDTNVGKSSLMNALFNEEKSIVTPIHGTTRDIVEGTLRLGGAKVIIRDTAGLRIPKGIVEQEGVKRTYNALSKSDVVIYMLDASKKTITRDLELIRQFKKEHTYYIIVINKIDKKQPDKIPWLADLPEPQCHISALNKLGIDGVKEALCSFIAKNLNTNMHDGYAVNQRHYESLKNGLAALTEARSAFDEHLSEEFFAEHLKEGSRALAEIVGEISTDTILDRIFSSFCIGK